MEISFSTIPGNLRLDNGYGHAGFNVIKSLQALGHKVPYDYPKAPVQLHFSQPNWYRFHKNQYRIGYTPWESTKLPGDDWLKKFNETDELWTPTEWCKQVYLDNGVNVPIYVYKHGVGKEFQSVHREAGAVLKFLHIGHPSPRKDALMAVQAFRDAFGDRTDVSLTVKAYKRPGSTFEYNNVTTVEGSVSSDELVKLYHDHHCLVYPSWGEGFGMIPLEALATGMPVICTEAWAPYSEYIIPLDSTPTPSPWKIHHGDMYKPDYDQLVSHYRMVYDEYEGLAASFHAQAPKVHAEYDWVQLTENAFEHVVQKFA